MNTSVQSLDLVLSEEKISSLKKLNEEFGFQLENHLSPQSNLLNRLRDEMRSILEEQVDLYKFVNNGEKERHVLWLHHFDNTILNLPWRLAVEDIPSLHLSKGLSSINKKDTFYPINPLPLKILVMISSPIDSSDKSRLSYEAEEDQIIKAFQNLLITGKVQIDFTEGGSLSELERKLKANHYHILHFSGHSIFKNQKGYLQLEDPVTMKNKLVEAEEFAKTLLVNPEHLPHLVLLSSCQSSQGKAVSKFKGITNRLLQLGVPAVVAMSLSVSDYYATQFAGEFFRQLSLEEPIHRAFKLSLNHIRSLEAKQFPNSFPAQWMIPQLYYSTFMDQLIDWEAEWENLKHSEIQFHLGQNRLLIDHYEGYQFIGRRKERKEALNPLLNSKSVLLKGQGGVGKTALAEHLIQRVLMINRRSYPFIFNENTTSQDQIIDSIIKYLQNQKKQHLIRKEVSDHSEVAMEQLSFLLKKLPEFCDPIFVFDNLESFQSEPGGAFSSEYTGVAAMLTFLYESNNFPLLLTSRYPLLPFPDIITVDLNQVRFADFWKKCLQLGFQKMVYTTSKPIEFRKISQQLFSALGGNYRALELFDDLYQKDQNKSMRTLEELEILLQTKQEEVVRRMSEDLIFDKILLLLSLREKEVLAVLSKFRKPVLSLAIEMQDLNYSKNEIHKSLDELSNFTFLEVHENLEAEKKYYYINPLSKYILAEKLEKIPFSNQKAGDYFYSNYKFTSLQSYSELEESYHHYLEAKNIAKINKLGDILCAFYSVNFLYEEIKFVALKALRIANEEISPLILIRLGSAFHKSGDINKALEYFQKSLTKFEHINDKDGLSSVLNNIGLLYSSTGNYEKALSCFNESLDLKEGIDDKKGESTTLNNIGQVYSFQAQHDKALQFYEKSWKISQEINDIKGEQAALINISQVYVFRRNPNKALFYLKKGLEISKELGDHAAIATALNNIGNIYHTLGGPAQALEFVEKSLQLSMEFGLKKEEATALGQIGHILETLGKYKKALPYLERALQVSLEIDDKNGATAVMNNLATVKYYLGDYDQALYFYKKSLDLKQAIGDKMGIGIALGNISQIYQSQGDLDQALFYLEQSLAVSEEIEDRVGIGTALNNIGHIYDFRGQQDKALSFYEQSLKIRRETGDLVGEATTLNNMGTIFKAKRNYKLAINYLKRSSEIHARIGDDHGLATSFQNIGNIFFSQGDFEPATFYYADAYALFKKIGSPDEKYSKVSLSAIHKKIGTKKFDKIINKYFSK